MSDNTPKFARGSNQQQLTDADFKARLDATAPHPNQPANDEGVPEPEITRPTRAEDLRAQYDPAKPANDPGATPPMHTRPAGSSIALNGWLPPANLSFNPPPPPAIVHGDDMDMDALWLTLSQTNGCIVGKRDNVSFPGGDPRHGGHRILVRLDLLGQWEAFQAHPLC